MSFALRHPFHRHLLTRRDFRERCIFRCDICSQEVRDAAYECEDECNYILHEACALVEIPLQIANHPIHPEHPLVFERGKYSCDLCDISHEASVVIATPTPLEEEGSIQPFYHDHPLTAFSLKLPNWICCGACSEPIPGPAYGCQTCDFFLHESCACLPREMLQHPFHPQHPLTLILLSEQKFLCHVCCYLINPISMPYGCDECGIMIHAGCATLFLSRQDQEKEDHVAIDHPSHEHQLLSCQVEETDRTKIRCAACNLKISGEVYYCLYCTFFLHKQCADELPHDMAHYLHPEHRLVLLPKPMYSGGKFDCDSCRETCSGMSFHCSSCAFDLDLKCAVQTSTAVRDGISTEIQYFAHDHPLVLSYYWSNGNIFCRLCLRKINGLAYSCNSCDYNMHRSCAELPLQLEHPLHQHPLNLVQDDNTCNNCNLVSEGFTFNCTECAYDLCFKCATERPTLKHQLHEHALSYFRSTPSRYEDFLCNSCGEVDKFDFYSCRRCNFNLHRDCLPLPPTIQHECHPYHPLVLFDRFVEGLPEYQYCDYCEELRNPDHGVYRCAREECWYTVHIECVLPQVTQHANPYLNELTNEIISLGETIDVKEKDLAALKLKLEELVQERRSFLLKESDEEV